MIQLTQEQLTEVASVYLGANTPFYFFDNLRRSDTVAKIAAEATPSQMSESVRELAAITQRDPEKLLTLFTLICALSFVPTLEIRELLSSLNLAHLKWGTKLVYFASQYINNDIYAPVTVAGTPDIDASTEPTVTVTSG